MWGTLKNRVTIRRRTDVMVPVTTAGLTLYPEHQPEEPSLLSVKVTGGASATGEVTIAGPVGGVLTTETLTFTGPLRQRTVNLFDSVTGITTSGLADESPAPDITVELRGTDNSPTLVSYVLVEDYPAQVDDRALRAQEWTYVVVPWAEHFEPLKDDLLYDDQGRIWEVLSDGYPGGTTVATHWRIRVVRFDAGLED